MRILNIYYKNINSLEGEGRISFDQGPIADSGVFAITGPNGSGKTSILDVITLGLYGETFRFDKPAEHIITKHSDESLAQVEFAFGGEKYRSSWHVTRANANQPDMVLTRLNGQEEVLADSPNQVRNFLAELTGMDFHKFSKCIVLPQGDFAAFLNALDSERLDILEKISGTDLYADYRRQAESKNSGLREKTALLEQETALIPVLSDNVLQGLEHDLQDFTEQSAELKSEQALLQQQLQSLQNVSALESQLRVLERQQQAILAQVAVRQADLQKIADSPQAEQFREELRLLEFMQAEVEQNRAKLESGRSELSQLQQQLAAQGLDGASLAPSGGKNLAAQKQVIDSLKLKISEIKLELPRETELTHLISQQLAEKKAALADVENWLQAHQADAVLLSDFPEVAQLRNLRVELGELGGQQKKLEAWSKQTSASQKKNKTALAEAQARIQELQGKIGEHQQTLLEISQGKSFEELKELLADQQTRLKDFEELFSLSSLNARLTKKKGLFGWFNREIAEEMEDEAELQVKVDALKLEMSKEDNISRALEQAIANENILKKLVEYRKKLVDGKPCFLCGSTQHPYSLKPPAPSDSKKALADQRGRTQVLKSTLEAAVKQLAAAQKYNSRLSAKQKFLQEKRAEWRLLANRLNIAHEGMDINNVGLLEKLLIAEADELEKLKSLVDEHAQLTRHIAKAKNEIDSKQALLDKLRTAGEQLDANWAERSPEADEAARKWASQQAEEKALVAHLEQQLKLLGEKLPGKGKENALFDRLNSRRQDYQIYQLRQKGLREELADLHEKQQVCQAQALRYQQELTANLEALRSEEGLGLHLAVIDKQQLISQLEQQLSGQETALHSLREQLAQKLAENGFADLAQLAELLSLIDSQEQIRQAINDLTAEQNEIGKRLQQLDAQLQLEMQDIVVSVSEADLLATQKLLAEKIDIAEQEIRTLQNKLDKQQQYRSRLHVLSVELQESQRQLAESDVEIRQIRDEPGGLRRMIQHLLIEKLLAQTNSILGKISDRYTVHSTPSEHGLALLIEDRRQGNATRLPKTLSGGESFVVSLALALALAEIAGNGKTVESLFLDEGFGNLDADALYLAMSALESLKVQGKIVGVISHVDAVQKRIKTRIELVKKANGLSELKMVA